MPPSLPRRLPQWAAQAKADLRRDFPGWNILITNRGRWWALRGPLPPERINEPSDVEAGTPAELRAVLEDLTTAVVA